MENTENNRMLNESNSKIFYLDDNNNFADKDKATKSVIQVFDDKGNMVQEVWGVINAKEDNPTEDASQNIVIQYVDQAGNEVEKSMATHIIFKKYVNDVLENEEKYELSKNEIKGPKVK